MVQDNKIIEALFSTEAIKVASAHNPFWYTSGTLGPFYINTHFLYHSQAEATALLGQIESFILADKLTFPSRMLEILLQQYHTSHVFKDTTDLLVKEIQKIEAEAKTCFDFISGGERRDFFFSILPAYFLNKPHLSIFKDTSAVWSDKGFASSQVAVPSLLKGKKGCHIVDLVTFASSYLRAWIPAVKELGATFHHTLAVVDRKQGGEEILAAQQVKLHSLAQIDSYLFQKALDKHIIQEDQLDMLQQFMENPEAYMKKFLVDHPHFIQEQLALGGTNQARAELAIQKKLVDSYL